MTTVRVDDGDLNAETVAEPAPHVGMRLAARCPGLSRP
jgi:hypothetical protein